MKIFNNFMTPRATTRTDIAIAGASVLLAIVKVVDTITQYKSEKDDKKEQDK